MIPLSVSVISALDGFCDEEHEDEEEDEDEEQEWGILVSMLQSIALYCIKLGG